MVKGDIFTRFVGSDDGPPRFGSHLTPAMTTRATNHWVLTAEGFDGLLAVLHPDRARAGELYEEIRRRLVKFFEWRGCSIADDLTDRTINRVAGKLQAGEAIQNVTAYSVGVARLIHLEYLREAERERQLLDEAPVAGECFDPEHEREDNARLAAFEDCFTGLLPDQRRQLMTYHTGEKQERINNRKTLAAELGATAGSLRIRMFRLREILEECITRRLAHK